MKKLFFVALVLVAIGCTTKEVKRPRDPWVFRSVLDKQPRMITITLHDDLFVAYDAQNCGLYKAWKGEVILDGPVYTTKHGPQPTTDGYAFFEQRLTKPTWLLSINGQSTTPTTKWLGHTIKNGQVTLNYLLIDASGNQLTVNESPEYKSNNGKPGLERTYTLSNVPEGTSVILDTRLTNLTSESDYETDGQLTVDSKEEKKYDQGTTVNLKVSLVLKSNATTSLTVYYHPGFEVKKETAAAPQDILAQGAALIDGSDCRTCHNEKAKTVGPSYEEVAKKYAFNKANVDLLASKIMEGGTGVWGQVPMTAHPDLMKEDADKMVHYILSLDGEKMESTRSEDVTLGGNWINFPLDNTNAFEKMADGAEASGLAASVYKIEGVFDDLHVIPDQLSPAYTAVAPVVHFSNDLFANDRGMSENVFIRLNGFVNIEQDGNYVFRLVSDDGSRLNLDNKTIIFNDGYHGPEARDAEVVLKKGKHPIQVNFYQGRGGMALSLQWAKHGDSKFSIIPTTSLSHTKASFKKSMPYVPMTMLVRGVPGDKIDEAGVHPSFDLAQARPSSFEPMVGGMDFLSDSSLIVCTWDSVGPVYRLEGVTRKDHEKIKVTRIAYGLAEPLGVKVVNDTIYVLQKQELTRLIDTDKDGIIDEYQTVCDGWRVSANFHEFAFGLVYKDGYFYAALATAIDPGGASTNPQIPDRGKVVKISKKDGSFQFIASGLRTPNGVGLGTDGELFITDNQGDWLPSSKVLHVTEGAWFGSRSVDFEGTANLKAKLPVAWLPQDEIGNSPSQPTHINVGPYKGQQLHGEVTHGGLKRVFMEKINGEYQGAVFRFTQGLEGGVNRVVWGPDGALYVGQIGNPGNWGQTGKKWYGLQKLTYNGNTAFEMLAVRAKSNGVEIEMTEPISETSGNAVSDYEVRQWYYLPTIEYGGPKLDDKALKIKSVNISEDRKKIFLELDKMEANHVVYVRLKGIFQSTSNKNLWATEAWYTMNQIPEKNPGFSRPASTPQPNTLSEREKSEGWKLLFDGKTTSGWRNFKAAKIGAAWKVNDAALYLDNSKKKDWQTVGGGDIVTIDEYENYELSIDWKVQPCGNSGIIFNVVESDKYDYVWQTGPEMQVLDNTCHPDGRIEKHRAGNLYDLIQSEFVSVFPAGEWNTARLISNKGHLEFWLNGYKMIETEMFTPEWEAMIKGSKFADMPDFGKAKKGRIALQDHGDKVWYRNIKIRELK